MQTSFLKLAERLSRADIVFYTMPALIALLVIGTLAQREMGLYDAHQMFFASFVFWWGVVPFPGGYTLLSILTLNLLLKFLLHSDWNFKKSGIIITHLGALVLLLGGLLTAMFAREGFMVIPEGQQTPFVYDYHKRELLIFENDQLIYAIPQHRIRQNTDVLPLNIEILNKCENCEILKRAEHEQTFSEDKALHSLAQFMALEPKAKEKEAEANISGFTFGISNMSEEIDGVYIAFEAMPKPIEFVHEDKNYKIIYGKQQRKLPFEVGLKDFVKDQYPGMDMARGYSSDVVVMDQGAKWETRIEMNAPLRYKGYTFYQSSFDQSVDGETTVLSVVENKGRIFPYIGTFVIAFGLLLHIVIIFSKRVRA